VGRRKNQVERLHKGKDRRGCLFPSMVPGYLSHPPLFGFFFCMSALLVFVVFVRGSSSCILSLSLYLPDGLALICCPKQNRLSLMYSAATFQVTSRLVRRGLLPLSPRGCIHFYRHPFISEGPLPPFDMHLHWHAVSCSVAPRSGDWSTLPFEFQAALSH